ncbi:Putative transposase of IS4/5 family [Streptomyces sp. Ncost-T10-10d]|nr:Putative transposase of IS4/5 family [Streptomyces sp. Ncost-T10-10d]
MPAVPSSLLEPLWVQFAALLPLRPEFDPTHPLGCHRRAVPDRDVFEAVVRKLVFGVGYERVAEPGCSDWVIRDRVKAWTALGLAQEVHRLALAAYEKMIGLRLDDLPADGCLTKASARGETCGPSPVDRRRQGTKRSTMTDAVGVPVGLATAGANRHDSKLLEPTIGATKQQLGDILPEHPTVHLDSAYNGKACAAVLQAHDLAAVIAAKGIKAPIQAGKR